MSKLVISRIFLMGRLRNSENGAYIAYGNSAPPVLITSGPLQCLTALTEISSQAITNQSSSKIAQEKVWRRYAGEQG